MKQVAQRSRDGRIVVVDAPIPAVRNGWVLVSNVCSVISSGTERSKLELGAMNIAQKALARPDLSKKVLEHARGDGIRSTVAAVRDRLDSLTPLGYSSAGIVRELGRGVEGLAPGDRVACSGGGWANHAEVVAVPKNLVAKIPAGVSFDDAAYGTIGAIALHGVRQSAAVVGERIGVIGLGLVGQLAVRILLAAGCQSVGIDLDPAAVKLAGVGGANAFTRDDPGLVPAVLEVTENLGLDAVLICAAGRSSDPIELAARLVRDRGRLVVVGDVTVAADRGLLYEKELELRLSRSYGPGRYDRDYEEGGRDLPAGYVRWTEQRNLGAFLVLVKRGRVQPSVLTTHRFAVDQAADAYAVLTASSGEPRAFGVLLEYELEPRSEPHLRSSPDRPHRPVTRPAGARIGLIGAGSFARRVLLPAVQAHGAQLVAVATEGGLSAADVASRFGFERAALAEEICSAEDVDAVLVATRHSSHAMLAATALAAGKAVFVEKPLALDWSQLEQVEKALDPSSLLVVGFNRRFAPLTERLRAALPTTADKILVARINAGPLPRDHWLNDAEEGGGRLIGEGCHFVDLITHLAGAPAATVQAVAVSDPSLAPELAQSFLATIRCSNGALGSIIYAGGGDPRLPKERVEGYGGGVAAVLDDFRRLDVYEAGKKSTIKGRADKGHQAQFDAFLEALLGRGEPPSTESYLASTRATLALADSIRMGKAIDLN
jgi:predicted dehydrogenase/NADPH:quinone reductase-like Zn-dependent oxidoreductase